MIAVRCPSSTLDPPCAVRLDNVFAYKDPLTMERICISNDEIQHGFMWITKGERCLLARTWWNAHAETAADRGPQQTIHAVFATTTAAMKVETYFKDSYHLLPDKWKAMGVTACLAPDLSWILEWNHNFYLQNCPCTARFIVVLKKLPSPSVEEVRAIFAPWGLPLCIPDFHKQMAWVQFASMQHLQQGLHALEWKTFNDPRWRRMTWFIEDSNEELEKWGSRVYCQDSLHLDRTFPWTHPLWEDLHSVILQHCQSVSRFY